MAERVLQAQGPGAWPVCSKKAGLSAGGGLQNQAVSSGATAKKATPKPKTEVKAQVKAQVKKTVKVEGTYTVQAGDSLSTIGSRFDASWQSIFAKNRGVVGDANRIFPGQQLTVK